MPGARHAWAVDALDSPSLSEFLQKIALSLGDIWWVDSATGSDDNDGATKDNPKATIDAAINAASAGDTIFVMPGHAEDITTAGAITADLANLRIIGLGTGTKIPTISTTAAAGSMVVSAEGVLVKNLKFVANFATGTTQGLSVTANGVTLEELHFRDTSAANEFLVHIAVAAAVEDLTVRGCTFFTAAGSMTGSVVFAGASTDTLFEDCTWYVDSSDSVVDHQTTAAVNFWMRRCRIINIDTATAGYCIELKTASTGCVHDCRFGYNKVDAEVSLGDAVWWFENYASNTIAESGVLDPSASHSIP